MAKTSILRDSKGRYLSVKDPNAVLDYSFDWSEWITDAADEITSFSFDCGGGIVAGASSRDNAVITVFVSGGFVGAEGSITCRINTAGGRTDDRTLYLKILEK